MSSHPRRIPFDMSGRMGEKDKAGTDCRGRSLPDRRHLQRLDRIYVPGGPLYYITVCVGERMPVLAEHGPASILVDAWRHAVAQHSWLVGRYVIMPDHVHFFATPQGDTAKSLSAFVGYWKRTTQSRIRKLAHGFAWQPEFFDHLLRSSESYGQKWEYVRQNPVRAQLVPVPEDWPYQGEVEVISW